MKRSLIFSMILLACIASERSFAQVVENQPPSDNFYNKENSKGKAPRPFAFVREADIQMKIRIWRVIDFREKFNQHFYYPIRPVQDRVSFMSMLMTAFKEGRISAYDPITDDFNKPLTYEEFTTANENVITRDVPSLDDPDIMEKRTDTVSFSNENVKLLRVKEDWFINRQRGERAIRIMGLCPYVQVLDEETGEFKGNKGLFWIRYDDCRDVFANTEAFNRLNSAVRMSYDDVFAFKRYFNSYIVKIDNQQDRLIQEYLTGWQLLAESERIKNHLIELEEDLWEY